MASRRDPWAAGHHAWTRLIAWHGRRDADDSPGETALDVMADIGTLRRLLDQGELAAVRLARQHRKSWAEIATQLGITRQSAWERWRDLDDDAPTPSPADDVAEELVRELTSPEARAQRRRAKVVVPNVVGMSWDDATRTLRELGLERATDPDGPSLAALGWPNVVVVDQVPEAGAKVPAGTPVTLWWERGGGSAGVREPRRPGPTPKNSYEWRSEPSDEAVG